MYKRIHLETLGDKKLGEDDFTYDQLKKELTNLRPLKDSSGELVGRACISFASNDKRRGARPGIVTAGGLRASDVSSIFGIFLGMPTGATRGTAVPIVEDKELARWASEQAGLVKKLSVNPGVLANFAGVIRACGGDTGRLPIAFGAEGWKSTYEIARWKNISDEVLLVRDYELGYGPERTEIKLNPNVLGLVNEKSLHLIVRREPWPRTSTITLNESRVENRHTIRIAVIESLAKAWSCSIEDVVRVSDFSQSPQTVGKRGRSITKLKADIIRNPRRKAEGS